MKKHIILATLIFSLFASCNTRSTDQDEVTPNVPDALEKSNSFPSTMKRGREDIVETLYAEVIRNAADLQRLQERLNNLSDQVNDSTATYLKFAGINDDYYTTAAAYVHQIKDTSLKQQIQTLVNESKQRYTSKASMHASLMKDIERKQNKIYDLHRSLKVLLTIPLIQEYQDKSKPSTMPLEGLVIELQKLETEMKQLQKKAVANPEQESN
jgi:hypothetical protein